MGIRSHRAPVRISGAIVTALLVAGCGAEAEPGFVVVDNTEPGTNPGQTDAVIREDFDNTDWIEETNFVIHDVNSGLVTLPVRALSLPGAATGVTRYDGATDTFGLIEANAIVVSERATVEAADSVELRAAEEVRITGELVAGTGGVTVSAGQRIIVEGRIDSLGPVRLMVAEPRGLIEISGEVTTRVGLDPTQPDAPAVEFLGRGDVNISGRVVTTAASERTGGDILVNVYGNVRISEGRVNATADPGGTPGRVQIRSDLAVELLDGGRIGLPQDGVLERLGGDISVQAAGIRLGPRTAIYAGRGTATGAVVALTASGVVDVGESARVQSGAGLMAGGLTIHGRAIQVGESAVIQAGTGAREPAELQIEAVERIRLGAMSQVNGGAAECGPGGALTIRVSGPLLTEPGAVIRGGNSAVLFRPLTCSELFAGGDLAIQAREAQDIQNALQPGWGSPLGSVNLSTDPDIEVRAPNLANSVSGSVLSRVIDRGIDAFGFLPTLVDLIDETPEGTRVEIGLRGSDRPDGPFDSWKSLQAPASELESLRAARYVRYQINMYGRAFDAPTVDYVEIRLKRSEPEANRR